MEDHDYDTLVAQSAEEDCVYHMLEFHIVWNEIYCVPHLLFTGKTLEGRPLTSDELLACLPQAGRDLANPDAHDGWTFITQQDHPHTGRPWYALHPCGTPARMAVLLDQARQVTDAGPTNCDNYLLSWFSLVGPVVGLSPPLKAYELAAATMSTAFTVVLVKGNGLCHLRPHHGGWQDEWDCICMTTMLWSSSLTTKRLMQRHHFR
eukprot:jgi/Chlat1/6137/Chrsp41S05718